MTDCAVKTAEQSLRTQLAQGDATIAKTRPILRHLLAIDDQSLLSDAVVARIRSMLTDIARQMLHAVAAHTDGTDRIESVGNLGGDIAAALFGEAAFVTHAHALTIEAQMADRLHRRSGFDPVLPPLLQELMTSRDTRAASAAMHLLTAQARFMQHYRRMEWPLVELSEELLDRALAILAQTSSDLPATVMQGALHTLRAQYEAGERRAKRIAQLVQSIEDKAERALSIDHAGLAIFLTALAAHSGQDRDLAVMSLGENQSLRLALALRAAGLSQECLKEQLLIVHPEIELPAALATLTPQRAGAILAAAQQNAAD